MHVSGDETSLLSAFMIALRDVCLVRRGDSVLLCVSGGVDSMVMLDLFFKACPHLELKLGVIHVDHGLRPGESGEDALFVQRRCGQEGLPFHLVELGMSPGSANVEEQARQRRYEAVRTCMAVHGYRHAATGHTLDDQAETILYRIIRGTGIRGLAAMDARGMNGVIRPMLSITRAQVERYALDTGIPFVQDRTNHDTRFARNLIRHDLIPSMIRINPKAVNAIVSLGDIARLEGAALEAMALDLERDSLVHDWSVVKAFRLDELSKAPDAVLRRFIIRVVSGMTGDPRGIDMAQVVTILGVLTGNTRAHSVMRKARVSRDGDLLVFQRIGGGMPYALEVTGPGRLLIPEIRRAVRIVMPEDMFEPLLLRPYLRGDRSGAKRVADIMGAFKVPRCLRPVWPVLASQAGVVAAASFHEGAGQVQVIMEEGDGRQ